MYQTTPQLPPCCKAVNPSDKVVVRIHALLKLLHDVLEVLGRKGIHLQKATVDALELQCETCKASQHAEPADGRIKQLRIPLRAAGHDLAGGQKQVELQNVLSNGPHLPVVFTVDVHGR